MHSITTIKSEASTASMESKAPWKNKKEFIQIKAELNSEFNSYLDNKKVTKKIDPIEMLHLKESLNQISLHNLQKENELSELLRNINDTKARVSENFDKENENIKTLNKKIEEILEKIAEEEHETKKLQKNKTKVELHSLIIEKKIKENQEISNKIELQLQLLNRTNFSFKNSANLAISENCNSKKAIVAFKHNYDKQYFKLVDSFEAAKADSSKMIEKIAWKQLKHKFESESKRSSIIELEKHIKTSEKYSEKLKLHEKLDNFALYFDKLAKTMNLQMLLSID